MVFAKILKLLKTCSFHLEYKKSIQFINAAGLTFSSTLLPFDQTIWPHCQILMSGNHKHKQYLWTKIVLGNLRDASQAELPALQKYNKTFQ